MSDDNFDNVNKPKHYNMCGSPEPADIADQYNLDRWETQAVTYILRAKFKNSEIEDLRKAVWMINRKIKLLEKELASSTENTKLNSKE